MNEGFIDYRLNLNPVAWQILHALDGEPTFAPFDKEKERYKIDCETFAFYNGRERGFTLHVSHPDRLWQANLYIVFVENRSSDDIIVYKWEENHRLQNPPTPKNLGDANAWDSRTSFKTVDNAVASIQAAMREFLEREDRLIICREVLET